MRVNVVGNTPLTLLARLLFHAEISDVWARLWGFLRGVIRRLELATKGFELEADLLPGVCQRAQHRRDPDHLPSTPRSPQVGVAVGWIKNRRFSV